MRPRRPTVAARWVIPLLLAFASGAAAETVVVPASADTAIAEWLGPRPSPFAVYEDDYNFGAENYIPAGTRGSGGYNGRTRALFRFALHEAVPAGAVITSARAVLTVVRSPIFEQNSTFALHRLLVPWTEGRGNDVDPGGSPALEGEVCWSARAFGSIPWASPGAAEGDDYAASPDATQTILREGAYVFNFSPNGLETLQSMLDSPADNHGWILLTQSEGTPYTARQWASRTHLPQARRPSLEISFISAPNDISITYDNTQIATFTIEFTGQPDVLYTLATSPTASPNSWNLGPSTSVPNDEPATLSFTSLAPSQSPRLFYQIRASPLNPTP